MASASHTPVVERLREYGSDWRDRAMSADICHEAADTITELLEALAMSTAQLMSSAKAFEFRAETNEDRRSVAAMQSQCDFNRAAIAKVRGEA